MKACSTNLVTKHRQSFQQSATGRGERSIIETEIYPFLGNKKLIIQNSKGTKRYIVEGEPPFQLQLLACSSGATSIIFLSILSEMVYANI